MQYKKIIDDFESPNIEDEPRILALINTTGPLQMQIDQDGDHAYIDLYIDDVKKLIFHLNNWVYGE